MLEDDFYDVLMKDAWQGDFSGCNTVSMKDAARVYAQFSKEIEGRAVYAFMGMCEMHDGGMCLEGGVCGETCARVDRFRKLMLGVLYKSSLSFFTSRIRLSETLCVSG